MKVETSWSKSSVLIVIGQETLRIPCLYAIVRFCYAEKQYIVDPMKLSKPAFPNTILMNRRSLKLNPHLSKNRALLRLFAFWKFVRLWGRCIYSRSVTCPKSGCCRRNLCGTHLQRWHPVLYSDVNQTTTCLTSSSFLRSNPDKTLKQTGQVHTRNVSAANSFDVIVTCGTPHLERSRTFLQDLT